MKSSVEVIAPGRKADLDANWVGKYVPSYNRFVNVPSPSMAKKKSNSAEKPS